MEGAEIVTGDIMERSYAARTYRANLVEEIFMEEYDREMIKVCTSGSAIGQVNGLSVTGYGDFEFGLPHRISCTVASAMKASSTWSGKPNWAAPSIPRP